MKKKIFGVLQRIGRSFMLPIAVLPIAGMFLGVPIFCIIKLIYQEKWRAYVEKEKEGIEENEPKN